MAENNHYILPDGPRFGMTFEPNMDTTDKRHAAIARERPVVLRVGNNRSRMTVDEAAALQVQITATLERAKMATPVAENSVDTAGTIPEDARADA